jgi:hypothetical protein
MQKLYCYVDESGQDTEGAFFLVSVIIAETERDTTISLLEEIEHRSGKGRNKWAKSKDNSRIAYIEAVLHEEIFKRHLYFSTHTNSLDYQEMTIRTTANAIAAYTQRPYKATIIIDGLQKGLYRIYAAALRNYKVSTDKVRGQEDEKDSLLRLADALCGFIRDAIEGKPSMQSLLKKAVKQGYIIEIGTED